MKKFSKIKTLLAVALVVCTAFTSTACSSGNGKSENSSSTENNTASETGYYRHISKYNNLEKYETEGNLNAKDIYDNLTYIPEMFYGRYIFNESINEETTLIDENMDAFQKLSSEVNFQTIYDAEFDSDYEVSSVPVEIRAGIGSNYSRLSEISKYNWMTMTFIYKGYSDRYSTCYIKGAYFVDGNTLSFHPLSKYQYDLEAQEVTEYEISNEGIDYEFSFTGGAVTLKNGNDSITLTAKGLSDKTDDSYISNYLSSKDSIDDIIGFSMYKYKESDSEEYFAVKIADENLDYPVTYQNVVADFYEDGLMTFSWAELDGTERAYEFVYFFCGYDGLVLTDGKKTYCYTNDYSAYKLGSGISTTDNEALASLDEGKIEAIALKKNNLQDELMTAFNDAGINVTENKETGEIMLDSSVLFAVDEYKLSDSGKSFLKKFLKVYSSVILKDDYDGFVSKILVEGHTDSTGEYDHNLELSKNRADEVLAYCISDKTGLDSSIISDFKSLMESVGYADDYPVKDENGTEDKDKSRRVSFKFVIDLDNASQLEVPTTAPATEAE